MPIETIAGVQLLLYGLAWAVAGWLVVEERPALLCWTAYAWLHAMSALVAAPVLAMGGGPPMASLVGSTVGFAAAARGVDFFATRRARFDRWGAAILLPTMAAMVLAECLASTPQEQRLWVAQPYSLGLGLLLLFYGWRTWGALRREFGRLAAALVLTPMAVTGLLALVSFIIRLRLDPASYAALQSSSRLPGVLMSLVSSALFNFAFFFLLVARLVARLREGARLDHLTGAPNRRSLEASLEAAWQQHRRAGGGLAVAMVDIDHFKRINDQHGHAAGDRALRFAASVLRERTRPYDTVGRWGGEEFLVIMPGVDADGALQTCDRLRAALGERTSTDSVSAFTVSIGIAAAASGDGSAAQLVERADQALYEAKRAGRDRVAVAA